MNQGTVRRVATVVAFASSWGVATVLSISLVDSSQTLPLIALLIFAGIVLGAFYTSGIPRGRMRRTTHGGGRGEQPPKVFPLKEPDIVTDIPPAVALYPIFLYSQKLPPFSGWEVLSEAQSENELSFSTLVVNAYQLYVIAELAARSVRGSSANVIRAHYGEHLHGESASVFSTLCGILDESIDSVDQDTGITEEIPLEYLLAIDMLEDHPASPYFLNSTDPTQAISGDTERFEGCDWRLSHCLRQGKLKAEDIFATFFDSIRSQSST